MIFPQARQCADLVADPANEQGLFVADTMVAISDALHSGAYSCTVAIATFEGEEVNPVIADLRQKGYSVTNDGTELTISWTPGILGE